MAMAKLLNNWVVRNTIIASILCSLGSTLGCLGCDDYSAFVLKPEQVINYGGRVASGKAPVEAVVFGQIVSGDSTGRSKNLLVGLQEEIFEDINKLRDLPDQFAFDGVQLGLLDALTIGLENNAKALSNELGPAGKSATGAKALADKLKPYVNDGNQEIAKLINKAKLNMPPAASGAYEAITTTILKNFERLYQSAILMALQFVQKEAAQNLVTIDHDLDQLRVNLETKLVIANDNDREVARAELLKAENASQNVSRYVGQITKNSIVAADFILAVKALLTAIGNIERYYFDKAEAPEKAETKDFVDQITAAAKTIELLANSYDSFEKDIKRNSDIKLKGLFGTAGNVAVTLGQTEVTKDTDVASILRDFLNDPVLIIESDESSDLIVYAMASAVVHQIALNSFGLGVANVWGLDSSSLKSDIGGLMAGEKRDQIGPFLKSRARLLREGKSVGGHKNIYVINADPLLQAGAAVADVALMANELKEDGNKVLIIAEKPAAFDQIGKRVDIEGLDLASAIQVADAVIKENPRITDTMEISEAAMKIAVALSKSVSLAGVRRIMSGIASRMRPHQTYSAMVNAVKAELAKQGIPESEIEASEVLKDTPQTIEAKLRANRSAYRVVTGAGASRTSAEQLAESRKARQELKETKDDQEVLRKAMEKKAGLDTAVKKIEDVVATKRRAAIDAMARVNSAIDGRIGEIKRAFQTIKNTADTCLVSSDVNSPKNVKFDDAKRQAMFNILNPAPLNSVDERALKGVPDLTNPADPSWVSCLVFFETTRSSVNDALNNAKSNIDIELLKLKNSIQNCLNRNNFSNVEACFEAAETDFDNIRREFALNSTDFSKSLIRKAFDGSPKLIDPGVVSFWEDNAGTRFATIANSLGRDLYAGVGTSFSFAASLVNRNYYIKSLLQIIGSSNGRAAILEGEQPTEIVKLNPTATGAYVISATSADFFAMKNKYLRPLLQDFDDNDALMIKARREINKEYHQIVEYMLAKTIYDDVVKKYFDIAAKFWSMPVTDLKRFQENGAAVDSTERKNVWDNFDSINLQLGRLAAELEKNYVKLSDGQDVVANDTDLTSVVTSVENLLINFGSLKDALDTAINTHIFDGLDLSLQSAITLNISGPFDVFFAKIDVIPTINKFLTGGVAVPVDAVTTPVGAEIWKMIETAYDLLNFNYFKLDGLTPLTTIAPARNYPVWHSKYGTGTDPIKHPLEP
jgi:hypothetical protein